MSLLDYDKKIWETQKNIFAFDEAGYGCFSGSLFIAGVVFDPMKELPESLKGVKDSKKLSEKRRFELAAEIRKHAKHVWLHEVTPEEINNGNVYWLRYEAAAIEAASYLGEHQNTVALFDGNQKLKIDGESLCLKKGDSISFSIAAASIIAKTAKDEESYRLDKVYPQYGFANHKGYGTAEHRDALKRYGMSPVHREKFCRSTLS